MSAYAASGIDLPLLFDGDIMVPIGSEGLHGTLTIPRHAKGLVLATHGGGSSRYSPRYRMIASGLNNCGLATLLIDLLTEEEDALDRRMAEFRFEVYLLGARMKAVTEWSKRDGALAHLPIGYLGSGTGSAAAIIAAASLPTVVRAVVSRGGRPDMANAVLNRNRAATLLIAGELDEAMMPLNREAFAHLDCEKELVVVPGATQQFEEAGALETVERLSCEWFSRHLALEQASSRPRYYPGNYTAA